MLRIIWLKIANLRTLYTGEVVVRIHVGIKTKPLVAHANNGNKAVFFEKLQIAVNGIQRDRRHALPNALMDHNCVRVVSG